MTSDELVYLHYFKWNESLLNYFFKNNRSCQILLYIDRTILERIGKDAGIESDDYFSDLGNSVINFCNTYYIHACPSRPNQNNTRCTVRTCQYHEGNYCFRTDNRRDILAVAKHIYSRNIRYRVGYEDSYGRFQKRTNKFYELPVLAITIYVLLLFDNGDTQQWSNLGNLITPGSRSSIRDIWEHLYSFDNRFDKDASVYDRTDQARYEDYVGRIKYHLPLSVSIRNVLNDAIYKTGVWKQSNSLSFYDTIQAINQSVLHGRRADEIDTILRSCYLPGENNEIYARKIQELINDFDVDEYKRRRDEKGEDLSGERTRISGLFALALNYPDEGRSSVVLLTTVQIGIDINEYSITESSSGSISGFNTSPVKYYGSYNVRIENHSINTTSCSINQIEIGDVVFFFRHNDNLYIQTRVLSPSCSYVICVRRGRESVFEEWCTQNSNTWEKLEDTDEMYGQDWTVYFSDSLSGQYYEQERGIESEARQINAGISLRGGICNHNREYFINALPCFEVSERIDTDTIKVYMNINNRLFTDYDLLISEERIVLDIHGNPLNDQDHRSFIDITFECPNDERFHFTFNVCTQEVNYSQDKQYGFDRYFRHISEGDAAICGNIVNGHYLTGRVQGYYSNIELKEYSTMTKEMYFVNLLAACCYDSDNSEIGYAKFRKCVEYASHRLNINPLQENFIRDVRRSLVKAGIVSVDYDMMTIQAVPPMFSRVPFVKEQGSMQQLIMLSGCYTRSFITGLLEHCNRKGLKLYSIQNKASIKDTHAFLPPIILIDSHFIPSQFKDDYHQQFDTVLDSDIALSLINTIPEYKAMWTRQDFSIDPQYLNLKEPASRTLPRIRENSRLYPKHYYIESKDRRLAEIKDKALLPWASLYCKKEAAKPVLIYMQNPYVLISKDVSLPTSTNRALYMMNLGLPECIPAFICHNASSGSAYELMYSYNLQTRERCNLLAKLIAGKDDLTSVRPRCSKKEYKMEYWNERMTGHSTKKSYLVLYDEKTIVAVSEKDQTFIMKNGVLRRIVCESSNEVLSNLITEKWRFKENIIEVSQDRGHTLSARYSISNETMDLPEKSRFNVYKLTIV